MELNGAILRNFYNVGALVTKEVVNAGEFFSLKVPHYQRPYKWTKSHVEQLVSDWNDHKNHHLDKTDRKKEYFAGSIVTVASEGDSFHSLIDGQQRYTTLFLANFINFSLLRLLILSAVQSKRCSNVLKHNKEFEKCINFLFNKESEVYIKLINGLKFLRKLEDEDEMASYHENNEGFEQVLECLILPQYFEEKTYREQYAELLEENLNQNSFNLFYDRSSFNQSLCKVISRCFWNFSERSELLFINQNSTDLNDNERVYADAIESMFNKFKEINPIKNSEDITKYTIRIQKEITNFLDTVNLCVIQTANTDDAYILFEVMNDRALALDDLDLIKNQFFKTYVTKAGKDDKQVDDMVQKLDDQWINSIFHHQKMGESYKKLVTYYATVYITGDSSLKQNDKFRTSLANYLNKKDSYSKVEIQRDFNIFQIVFEILTLLQLPLQRRDAKSLVIENNQNSTSFQKVIYFLNAVKQEGVISGLINLVLRSIEEISLNFEIVIAREFIKTLIDKEVLVSNDINNNYPKIRNINNENILELHQLIQSQSKQLWKESMLARNADAPRKLSTQLIDDNHLNSNSNYKLKVKLSEHEIVSFESWLKDWNYDKDSKFKIKSLFLRLLHHSYNSDKQLVIKPIALRLSDEEAEKVELDHLIATKSSEKETIFRLANIPNDEQEIYLNSIGNMMILTKRLNIIKSDNNLVDSLPNYGDAGLNQHFLFKEIESFAENSNKEEIENMNYFIERKNDVITHFINLMELC